MKRLKEIKNFVRNKVKKSIQNPTPRWVFFLFRGITELTIQLDETVEKKVANMTDELWDILSVMGKNAENILFDGRPAECPIDAIQDSFDGKPFIQFF